MGRSGREIEVVEGPEAVRRRPEMFVGAADGEVSLCRRLLEVVLDSVVERRARAVRLTAWATGAFTLGFDGEALPIAGPALYELFLVPGDPSRYGFVVLNALSEKLAVWTTHEGSRYRAAFQRGGLVSLLARGRKLEEDYGVSWLTFRPDAAVMPTIVTAGEAASIVAKVATASSDIDFAFYDRSAERPEW